VAVRVTLTFVYDGDEDAAWDIAEKLEQAAIKRNYREVNAYANQLDARGQVLTGTEQNPGAATSAVTEMRHSGEPMSFGTVDGGMITLGDEHGRSA